MSIVSSNDGVRNLKSARKSFLQSAKSSKKSDYLSAMSRIFYDCRDSEEEEAKSGAAPTLSPRHSNKRLSRHRLNESSGTIYEDALLELSRYQKSLVVYEREED